jgi:hypothetical protein
MSNIAVNICTHAHREREKEREREGDREEKKMVFTQGHYYKF